MSVYLTVALKVMLMLKDLVDYSTAQNSIAASVHLLMKNVTFVPNSFLWILSKYKGSC